MSTPKNLTQWFISAVLAVVSMAGMAGCGEGPQPVDKQVDQAQSEIATLGAAAKAAGGDYNKLSQADKDKFLARVQGNEAQAAQMVSQMGGGGGPRGPGAK
jgi:hypothetical protein